MEENAHFARGSMTGRTWLVPQVKADNALNPGNLTMLERLAWAVSRVTKLSFLCPDSGDLEAATLVNMHVIYLLFCIGNHRSPECSPENFSGSRLLIKVKIQFLATF